MDPTIWRFSQPLTQARTATVMLAVFATGPLDESLAFDAARFGAVDLARYDVRTIARAADPSWFEAWRRGSLRQIAERDLAAPSLAALDAADCVHMVSIETELPVGAPDLAYLQGAWAVVRFLVARATDPVILDCHAMRYVEASALPAPGVVLDVGREIQVIFETDSARSDRAHALHTRGMIKFGAPDLVALCTDADADLVCRVLAQVAASIARGATVESPRHGIALTPEVTWFLVDDEHGLADLLQLNNRARVIVDQHGKNLLGVAAGLLS